MPIPTPSERIRHRITSSAGNTVFVASDFNDLANNTVIRQSLSRLAKAGLLRRILHGVYVYPKYSQFLQEHVAPSPHSVALAIARNYGWNIVPEGNTALNLLGLSTQVPAEWTYVSDGPYRLYSFDRSTIHLKKTANRNLAKLPYKSALLVQAIKTMGRDRLDDVALKRAVSVLSNEEKAALLVNGKYITQWIYEAVKALCKLPAKAEEKGADSP